MLSKELLAIFPNAVYILFTSIPPQQNSKSRTIFGDIVYKYDLGQAIDDGLANPVRIEHRRIEILANYPSYIHEYPELDLLISISAPFIFVEFVNKLAEDIVQHFEARQKKWIGKGAVVVPDLKTGVALSQQMVVIKPNWRGDTEFTDSVKTISATESPTQRAILVERFRKRDDPFSLLIATGSFLLGFDNPLIHTIYVTNPISLQLRYRLASLVSRHYQGKKDGLIVDYMGLAWDLE